MVVDHTFRRLVAAEHAEELRRSYGHPVRGHDRAATEGAPVAVSSTGWRWRGRVATVIGAARRVVF